MVHYIIGIAWFGISFYNLTTPQWNVSSWADSGLMDNGETPIYNPGLSLIPVIDL